jgi:flagellar biosynthesis/type III secretory pathway protein FliH
MIGMEDWSSNIEDRWTYSVEEARKEGYDEGYKAGLEEGRKLISIPVEEDDEDLKLNY